MFTDSNSFNQNISNWDVSSVTDMSAMFANATSFNQDISSWNVSNVYQMTQTFYNATSFNQNISSWDVSNVIYYGYFGTNSPLSSNPSYLPNLN